MKTVKRFLVALLLLAGQAFGQGSPCTLTLATSTVKWDGSDCTGAGGGSGITSLGGLTGATQTFDSSSGLTISSSSTTHTFTLGANLVALAGLTSAADTGLYFAGSGTAGTFTLTSFGRTLAGSAAASNARTTLGLVIGTDVQGYSARLGEVGALSATADNLVAGNGSAFVLKALLDCQDTGGNHLNYNTTTHAFTCGTSGGGGGGSPGGSDTQVQFNDGGSFGGDSGVTYAKATDTLSSGKIIVTAASAAYAPGLGWPSGDGWSAWSFGSQHQVNGTNTAAVGSTGFLVRSDGCYFWHSTTSLNGTTDTATCRGAAGVVTATDSASGIGAFMGTIWNQDAGTRPTCDSSQRGKQWYDAGAGGVADTFSICGKSAADSYSWVTLATF